MMKRNMHLSKLLILFLASVMLFCAVACSDQPEKQPDEPKDDPEDPGKQEEPQPVDPYSDVNLIIMSDVHLCHLNWYGMSSPDRINKMIDDLNDYRKEYKYDAMLFLGDYSLDFWETGIYGSWRHQGVSNTANFLYDYAMNLDCSKQYIIPGNHEQYGEELWEELTGYKRQYYLEMGGYLIFMLDNFAGDLDPDTDNHGVYSPTDVEFITKVMAEKPGMPVILCAHFFDLNKETSDFEDLMWDERVVALFCGHDHVITVQDMGEKYNNKKIFHCGNYSYTNGVLEENPWGWRTLSLRKEGITVTYYAPESTLVNGKTYEIEAGTMQEYTIPNPLIKK